MYLELRRRYGRLHEEAVSYFSSDAGNADFVVDTDDPEPLVVQVCASLSAEGTRARELAGACAAMEALGVRKATIVTLTDAERVTIPAGTVEVVPAWRWMLEG